MSKFDHNDYQQNPGKYRLFKTAELRFTIINEGDGVPAGTIVGIEYCGDVYNRLHRRTEPVYRLSTGDNSFANGLQNFTL